MTPRFDYHKQAPQGIAPLLQLESYLRECGLDHPAAPSAQDAGVADQRVRLLLLRRHFTVDLTLAIVAINAWNRLAITFHPTVGSYQPRSTAIRHGVSS